MRVFLLSLTFAALSQTAAATVARAQTTGDDAPARRICPAQALRKGACPPPTAAKSESATNSRAGKLNFYRRVRKLPSSAAADTERVRQINDLARAKKINYSQPPPPPKTQPDSTKTILNCLPKITMPTSTAPKADSDLSLTLSRKVGVTVWRMESAKNDSAGARILTQEEDSDAVYRAVRFGEAEPVIRYGDRTRISIESPRGGFLYVFKREIYDDGSIGGARLISSARGGGGGIKIAANRPVEIPAPGAETVYFEARRAGLEKNKTLAGEIFSVLITDQPLGCLRASAGADDTEPAGGIPAPEFARLENAYAGRTEVFELENGGGQAYSIVEQKSARFLSTPPLGLNAPYPQTLYLLEDKKTGGALATVVLKYESSDRALLVGIDRYPAPIRRAIGARNDALRWKRLLTEKFGFSETAIKMLLDEQATDGAIRRAIRNWLIEGTQPGDRVFLFFAGHGAQTPDADGDEKDDGRDETIIPYDAKFAKLADDWLAPTGNFISDDEISQWLAELAFRRVVFVFDSCHSGTIFRGDSADGESEARLLSVNDGAPVSAEVTGSRPPRKEFPNSKSKDALPFDEPADEKLFGGAVVISAARAGEEAMPVKNVPGAPMGAFSYLLTEMLEADGAIPISQLEDRLRDGVSDLKKEQKISAGRGGRFQQPEVKAYSRLLERQPLFGGFWTQAPVTALSNPLSKYEVSLRLDSDRKVFLDGDKITARVRTNRAGYLYLLVFSEQDTAVCLVPDRRDEPFKIEEGSYELKGFEVAPPFGTDVWVALVTDRPLDLGNYRNNKKNHKYRWNDIFEIIGIPELRSRIKTQIVTRGAVVVEGISDWQAASVVIESRPR